MPPSIHDLHTALWSSFLNLKEVRGFPLETAPMSASALLAPLLEAIDEEGREHPDPHRVRVPRPLLGLAAWNLLSPENVDNPSFEQLVRYVTGMSAKEVLAIYEQTRNPLLFLARQYNILDYDWEISPQETAVRVRLEVCVQTPFPYLNAVVFPDQWPRCPFFWDPFKLPRALGWSKDGSGHQELEGELHLPGGPRRRADSVLLNFDYRRSALDCENKYVIKGAPFHLCSGVFTAAKEVGKPGATRIAHEKEIDFGQPPSGGQIATLAYWLQAELVSLILPA
jgi:hypothetical protein